MANKSASQLGNLLDLIAEIGAEKRATEGVGKTTFPQESVDDGTKPATTGSHAAENTSYVKEEVPGQPIDSSPEAKASDPKQDSLQPQIGATQSTTGTDPSAEDNYKDKKDDPGTDHPAKADSGEKYGSWDFGRLAQAWDKAANGLLAELHVENKQAAAAVQPQAAAPVTPKAAAAAGYAAAAGAGVTDDARARMTIEATVKEAFHMADLAAAYLRIKWAEEEEASKEHEKPEEGDAPPEEGGGPPPDAGLPPGAGGPPPGAGGPPPEAGGDPMAQLLGGDQPPPGAPPTGDESMQGMNGAMDDMQITPELLQQLIQLLQAQAHPQLKTAAENLREVAARARAYRLQGKYEVGPAKTARVHRIRSECRGYLSELMKSAGILK